MKRLLMILVSALLVTGINGCGSPDPKTGTSAVTINLGETKTASPSGKILGASSIPPTIVSVRFTISASDMATIERTVFVEGRSSISESFDVPNGANRHFVIEAADAAGNVIYRGDAFANLDGTPVAIAIPMASAEGLGLSAQYSTGDSFFSLIEGPVFHGYWTTCDTTNYNLYQGVCTPLSSSPVDWASGTGFSVTWTGYLYVPASGDYTFSSYYWVDGIVYIEVNGIVVADLNTTGAGYSKVITLQGGTWVPVYMTFSPNGGSNNMHLGWTPPGGTWEPVPKQYLAPSLP